MNTWHLQQDSVITNGKQKRERPDFGGEANSRVVHVILYQQQPAAVRAEL